MGLLVTSVMQAGGRVLEGFRVQFPSVWRLDILNYSLQWLRGQLMELGRAARMRNLAQRRATFGHHGAIDRYISRLSGAALTP